MHPAYTLSQSLPRALVTTTARSTGTDPPISLPDPESSPSSLAERNISPSAPAPAHHGTKSCTECRRRKVKCDRQVPCSNCTRAHSQCVYPPPGRACKWPRQIQNRLGARKRDMVIKKSLRELKDNIQGYAFAEVRYSPPSDQSSQQRDGNSAGDPRKKPAGVRVVGMDEGPLSKKDRKNKGSFLGSEQLVIRSAGEAAERLVVGKGRTQYIEDPVWAEFGQRVEELCALVDNDYESESDDDDATIPTDGDHQSFVMGYCSSDVDLGPLHPLPSQLPFYWEQYLDNVEPMIKILHVPTMNKTIKEVQNNPGSLSASTEALMFAIYFATITSMTDDNVMKNMGADKEYFIRRYRFGVEQALARADFLSTKEIVTVQAFVLFLVCVRRHDESRFVWTLTGVLVNTAQALGLHRDGTKLSPRLSPFDTEMRRRLWWQICLLDVRAATDHGLKLLILDESFDTEYPLCINDTDIEPQTTELATERQEATDMSMSLFRYIICSLTRNILNKTGGPEDDEVAIIRAKERMIEETRKLLDEKYMSHCEGAGVSLATGIKTVHLALARMSLIIYQPLTQPGRIDDLSQEIRDRLFEVSIEILEHTRPLELDPLALKWGWLHIICVPWQAIGFILGELLLRPRSSMVARAWIAIEEAFYGGQGSIKTAKTGMQWAPLNKLLEKAKRKRAEDMRENRGAATALNIDARYAHHSQPLEPLDAPSRDPRTFAQTTNAVYMHAPQYPYPPNLAMTMASQTAPSFSTQVVQLQPQQLQPQMPQQAPWILQEALQDLDMGEMRHFNYVSWDHWDDIDIPDPQAVAGHAVTENFGAPPPSGHGRW